jgi:TetR/AcrR family transcriptional repressor of nem operon
MPRPPNPEVRIRLLEAGRNVVHEQSFNGSGVQDIADAAGVPKGSFYNYFESKESFAAEILEQYWQSIADRHGPLLRDSRNAPLARVRKFFRSLSHDHTGNGFALGCLIGNLSLELSAGSDTVRRKLLDLLHRWQSMLSDCLNEAQARGELGKELKASELAAVLIETYEGAVMRSKVERSPEALERFEKIILPRLLQ